MNNSAQRRGSPYVFDSAIIHASALQASYVACLGQCRRLLSGVANWVNLGGKKKTQPCEGWVVTSLNDSLPAR